MRARRVRLGTRRSALATAQSGDVARRITEVSGIEVDLVGIRTEGDVRTGPLASMGGTGVFVSALRDALIAGSVDIAVHSLKDLPTAPAAGLVVAAVPAREDPRDVLLTRTGVTLADLPEGARIGTGSPRRAALLRLARPDLRVEGIRGNVDTRIALVTGGRFDGVVLARAGLARLGRLSEPFSVIDADVMPPAPGQGALAVEAREGVATEDPDLAAALAALEDPLARAGTTAERVLLATLEAGCSAPVGTYTWTGDGGLNLRATVCRADRALTREGVAPLADAARLGRGVAASLLDAGASDLIASGV